MTSDHDSADEVARAYGMDGEGGGGSQNGERDLGEEGRGAIEVCTADDLAGRIAELEWLWTGWVPFGHLTVLAGEPGAGKSAVALWLAACATQGLLWPDGAVNTVAAGPVLIADTEGAQAVWVERIRGWGIPRDSLLFPGLDGFGRVQLDDLATAAGIGALCGERGIRLVIIDSLRTSLPAAVSENDSVIATLLAPWGELCRDLGIACVLVHHFAKAKDGQRGASLDRLRGSGAIGAAARSVLAIDRPDAESAVSRLQVVKSNLGLLPEPIGFAVHGGGVEFLPEAPKAPRGETAADKAAEFLQVALCVKPRCFTDLKAEAAEREISTGALYRAKGKLGIVEVPDTKDPLGRRKFWDLPERRLRDPSGK